MNRAAFHWIRDTYDWHPLGIYKEMLVSQGKLCDFHLFSVRLQDQNIMWVSAEQRAEAARHLYQKQLKLGSAA